MRVGSLEIEIMAGIARLQKDMNDAQRIVGGSMANVERSVASAKRAMQTLGVGLPIAAITDQVRRMTDQYIKLDAQLRLSTKSQEQYAQGMSDIRRISTVAQADLSATSMLYTRLMNVMQGTGVEQSKLATVTETVSFGLKAYGATSQEASSAALQLSQAMGANRLGGEEFRAVMEAMPNVMKVLADSMGVPLGALRQLSIDGKVTADEMVKAFGNPAVAAEFKRLAENAQTITGAWVVARNELMLLVGEFMKSSGATGGMIAGFNALGQTFKVLAEYMQQIVSLATVMAVLYAGRYLTALQAAWVMTRAHTTALAMDAAGEQARAAVIAASTAQEVAAKQLRVMASREAFIASMAENEAALAGVLTSEARTAAELRRAAAIKTITAANVAAIAEERARTTATVAATAAEAARASSALSWMGKLRGFAVSNALGLLGLALWGAYSIADHLGWVDALFNRASKAVADLKTLAGENAVFAQAMGEADMKAAQRSEDAARKRIAADLGIKVSAQATTAELIVATDAAIKNMQGAVTVRGAQFREDLQRLKDLRIALGQPIKEIATAKAAAQVDHDTVFITKQFEKLNAQRVEGSISQAEYAAGIAKMYQDLLPKQEQAIAVAREETKAQKELLAMREASAKYQQDNIDNINSETDALLKKIEQERFDTEAIGKTAEQLALLQSVRYDNITALQEQKVAALEASYGDAAEIAAIKEQIKARRELKGVWGTQATAQAADAQRKAWKEMWDSVDKTAHDTFVSILNGGKDTATRLKEAFKNGFFDWLYSMTLKKWIVNISGTMAGGTAGSAMAGGGGGTGGGGMGWMQVGNMIKDGFTGLSSSFTTLAGNISGGLQAMGMEAGTAGSIGVAGAYAGAGLAGIQLGTMIAGDKTFAGMSGQTAAVVGTAIGTALGGPIGAVIGGTLGGAVNAAFGRGPKQSGTTTLAGQFSGAGFAGQYQTPWSQKGGWFSSGRSGVDISPVAAEQAAALGALVRGSKSVFDNLLVASGDAVKSLDGWTFAIDRQVSTEAQAQQLTIDMADSMGNYLIPALAAFKQQGENLADTAVRMRDEFIVTDGILGLVGGSFGSVGLASMGARDNLVQLMGGVQGVNASMQSYYLNFFTDTERHVNDLRALTAQFAQLGLTIPDTATGFRLLVSSQDLSTESGRQLFAALMQMQGAFSALIPSAEQAAQAVAANIKALQDKSIADFEAARKATDSLRAFAVSVRDLQRSLWAGQQTPLPSTYSVTRSQFSATNALAGAGDINAQGSLAGSATAFLDAAKRQAVSAIEYARDFAFVQNSLNDTAMLTEDAVTVADQQLEEMRKSNAWLAALDDKSASQTQSLQYLLSAAVASSEAARLAIVEKSIAGLTSEIATAVGSGYNQANLSRSVGAAGETALSYAGAYKTVGGSVSAAGVSSGVSTTISSAQAAAAQDAAAAAARAVAESEARTAARNQAIAAAEANLINSWYMGTSTGVPVYNDPWSYAASMPIWASKGAGDTQAMGFVAAGQARYDSLQAAVDAAKAMPSYAVGTNALTSDGPIYAHAGEEVKPKAYVDADKVERAETNALLRDMRKELTLIKTHNYRMLLIQDKHDNEGMPEVRVA